MVHLTELRPFICVADNILNKDICDQIIERFEKDSNKYEARVGANARIDPNIRTGVDLSISKLEHWKDIDDILFNVYRSVLTAYMEKFDILKTFSLHDKGYIVQRVNPGQAYNWHSDNVNIATASRQVIALLYLRTIHKGGATQFKYQNLDVQPEAGKILIFPAVWTHKHRGMTPISETKYSIISWFCYSR